MSAGTITELVPHRAPMLLLESLVHHEDRTITCTASIGPDHPFLDNGEVDVLVCVELVAQSVAAYAGLRDRVAGRPPKIGFLVSCREATFEVPALSLGDRLTIETRHAWGDDTLGSFKGKVIREGTVLANVEIGVYGGSLDAARAGV